MVHDGRLWLAIGFNAYRDTPVVLEGHSHIPTHVKKRLAID